MVVHAASCDKHDSLMRRRLCDKLQGGQSQLFLACPAVIDPIGRESLFLPTPRPFDAPIRGVPVGILP